MCGKCTVQATWQQVVDFSQPLTGEGDGCDEEGAAAVAARSIRTASAACCRSSSGMRRSERDGSCQRAGGFPDPKDWRWPKPHARAETIDEPRTFRDAFNDGQRGVVVIETFNEVEEATKPSGARVTQQWTINPGDGQQRGFAFIWRRFEIADLPAPMLACVVVTVPANELIRRTIKSGEGNPRMPAILEDFQVWATWLGGTGDDPVAAKALLKTMEGVTWAAEPEPKKLRAPRRP